MMKMVIKMDKLIYDLLLFVENNNSIPSAKDLNIENRTLMSLIKRCLSDGLLDKQIIYINILDDIQCDESSEFAITIKGYSYLEAKILLISY